MHTRILSIYRTYLFCLWIHGLWTDQGFCICSVQSTNVFYIVYLTMSNKLKLSRYTKWKQVEQYLKKNRVFVTATTQLLCFRNLQKSSITNRFRSSLSVLHPDSSPLLRSQGTLYRQSVHRKAPISSGQWVMGVANR